MYYLPLGRHFLSRRKKDGVTVGKHPQSGLLPEKSGFVDLEAALRQDRPRKRVISIGGETENDVQWNTKILHLKRCDFCEYLKINELQNGE